MIIDYPVAVRVCGHYVVVLAPVEDGRTMRHYLTQTQAREFAARVSQVADQAEHGPVPTIRTENHR